jgi:Protein of unknown function (DUF3618)
MGQDPSEIRTDIEATRARMGDTAEALGHKADVPGRAKEAMSSGVESVKSTSQQAAGVAKENPLGLALGATAVGFVAGMLIPSTRVEDEKIGPMADQVKDKAKETGQEALERGKHVAQEAAQTVKDEGREQAQEMAPSS